MDGGLKKSFDGMVRKTIRPEDPVANTPNKEQSLLTWEGESFVRNLDGKRIAMFILVALGLIGYSVWKQDWFVIGIIVVVAAVTIWYLATSKPTTNTYVITALGVYEGEKFYPFSEIHSFWLVYNQAVQELFLAFDRKYLPALSINVKNVDPVLLKAILLKKIPEQAKRQESVLDKLVRIVGI